VLIDVRTRAEWAFVGLPDLSKMGKRVLTVEWQTSPESRIDAAFPARLNEVLDAAGADKGAELFFICRSGGRSRMAAEAMANAGYRRCRNVADGFEGPLDANRHRGQAAGWKAAGAGCKVRALVSKDWARIDAAAAAEGDSRGLFR
jgi:rhodanese-related sulfurtransferase